jgi:hypothetical protein
MAKRPRQETPEKETNTLTLYITLTDQKKHIEEYITKPNINIDKLIAQQIGKPEHIKIIRRSRNQKTDYLTIRCINIQQYNQLKTIHQLNDNTKIQIHTRPPTTEKINKMDTTTTTEPDKTYTPKTYKIVIKGVDNNQDPEQFKEINGITHVTKIKNTHNEQNNSNTLILTFDTQQIPEKITLNHQQYETIGYIPRPLRCDKCQRFGHHKSICKNKQHTCSHCSGNHTYLECTNRHQSPTCTNCGGQHNSAYKGCTKYIQTQEILHIRQEYKVTFQEAKKIFETEQNENDADNTQQNTIITSTPKQTGKTFAQVLQQDKQTQDKIETIMKQNEQLTQENMQLKQHNDTMKQQIEILNQKIDKQEKIMKDSGIIHTLLLKAINYQFKDQTQRTKEEETDIKYRLDQFTKYQQQIMQQRQQETSNTSTSNTNTSANAAANFKQPSNANTPTPNSRQRTQSK